MNIGEVYRRDGYGITITNIIISAGYHYDDIRYDVEVYHTPENTRKRYCGISEGSISEIIDTHHLRLVGDIIPIKKIKKLEIR